MLLSAICVEAQTGRDVDDVVYLKNGSIIRGTVIEQTDEEIRLQTYDGNIFVWHSSEVSHLNSEPTIYRKRRNQLMPGVYRGRFNPSPKGYLGIVEGFFGVGKDIGDDIFGAPTYGLNIINGYRFGHHFAMGFGTGFRAYSFTRFDGADTGRLWWEYCVPVYGHFRADFFKSSTTPLVALNVGYNMSFSEDNYSAFFAEPSLGVAFRTSDRNSVVLGLGCTFIIPSNYYWGYRTLAPFGNLSVGVTF